jgi:hypothetical protein
VFFKNRKISQAINLLVNHKDSTRGMNRMVHTRGERGPTDIRWFMVQIGNSVFSPYQSNILKKKGVGRDKRAKTPFKIEKVGTKTGKCE